MRGGQIGNKPRPREEVEAGGGCGGPRRGTRQRVSVREEEDLKVVKRRYVCATASIIRALRPLPSPID